ARPLRCRYSRGHGDASSCRRLPPATLGLGSKQECIPVSLSSKHRTSPVFFWANELGRQTGKKFDAELVFICAAFHDLGLLKKFSSATDRFEVDSANAVRQFLEHRGVPTARIQTAWDAISLHTTPGIAAYKPLEV